MLEATCGKCGETFNPADVQDIIHMTKEEGSFCGGTGQIVAEYLTDSATCTICHRPMERHAISGDLTCFLHGNPNGSDLERKVFERVSKETEPYIWTQNPVILLEPGGGPPPTFEDLEAQAAYDDLWGL